MQVKKSFNILRVVLPIFLLVFLLAGCSVFGKKQAVNLGWKGRIAVFPASIGSHEAAKGVVEPILYKLLPIGSQEILVATKVKETLENNATRNKTSEEYFSLLSVLHFSDEKMSKQIADALGCDYFLFVFVDEWGYYKENRNEYAHVALKLAAVEAASGKIMWWENRSSSERVFWWRPSLSGIAEKLIKNMLTAKRQKQQV